ncbi:MAG: ATP-binding cassette domain-containing protein [Actinomycetaceae bacterium]|nr:ATP-binding cassette domain-containing protein [Actinomycetaceae bacterium]
MHTPDSGTILYDGDDVTCLNVKERADYRLKNIGFIFQDFNLIDELTLWENVALPAVALGSSFRAEREKATELLSRVQCGDLAERYPSEVSGGQIQRCAIARALINSPKLVLADEPTGNLDPGTADNVLDLLLGLGGDTKVIMVTHDVKNAYRAQQVLSLAEGRLSVSEPSAEAVRP